MLRSIHGQALLHRLLSPAEALNVLTVGASNSDASDDGPTSATRVVLRSNPDVPAPYSPVGLGFRRSIKPDLLAPGGRRVYGAPIAAGPPTVLRPLDNVAFPPGILVAQPGSQGSANTQHYSAGMSNAAALVTHHAGRIHESLVRLRTQSGSPDLDDRYLPVLVKSLLAHASGWGRGLDQVATALNVAPHEVRQQAVRLLGYGATTSERSISGSTVRALLLGTGELSDREQAAFKFPLPPSLAATTEWRRLTITLAWISPIAQRSRRLRGARLWFEPAVASKRVVGVGLDRDRHATAQCLVEQAEGKVVVDAEGPLVDGVACGRCDQDRVPKWLKARFVRRLRRVVIVAEWSAAGPSCSRQRGLLSASSWPSSLLTSVLSSWSPSWSCSSR